MACRQARNCEALNAYVVRDFQGYGDLGVRAVAADAMREDAMLHPRQLCTHALKELQDPGTPVEHEVRGIHHLPIYTHL